MDNVMCPRCGDQQVVEFHAFARNVELCNPMEVYTLETVGRFVTTVDEVVYKQCLWCDYIFDLGYGEDSKDAQG